ncbi:MAG: hypothetical protein ACR2KP_05770 [Egibacteraceae bacterium]
MFGRKKRARSVAVDDQGTVECALCGRRSKLIAPDRCVLGHRVSVNNLAVADEFEQDTDAVQADAGSADEPEAVPTPTAYQRMGLFDDLTGASAPAERAQAAPGKPAEPAAQPAAQQQPTVAQPSRPEVARPAAPAEPSAARPAPEPVVAQPAAPAENPWLTPEEPAASDVATDDEADDGWGFDELVTWDEEIVAPSSLDV